MTGAGIHAAWRHFPDRNDYGIIRNARMLTIAAITPTARLIVVFLVIRVEQMYPRPHFVDECAFLEGLFGTIAPC